MFSSFFNSGDPRLQNKSYLPVYASGQVQALLISNESADLEDLLAQLCLTPTTTIPDDFTTPQVLLVDGRSYNDYQTAYDQLVNPLRDDASWAFIPLLWILEENQEEEFETSRPSLTASKFEASISGENKLEQNKLLINSEVEYEEIVLSDFFYLSRQTQKLFSFKIARLVHLAQHQVNRRVSHYVQAQEERQLLLTLNSLENNTQDAVITIDPSFKITYWNKGAERIYGWNARQVIGQSISLIDYDGPLSPLEASIRAANPASVPTQATGNLWTGTVIHKNRAGNKVIITSTVNAVRNSDGTLIELLGINRDVTDQILSQEKLKAQKEELEEAKHFLESIIEQSPIGILIYDKSGVCMRLNSACAKMYGFENPELLIGKFNVLEDQFSIESGLAEKIKPVFEKAQIVSIPFQEYDFQRVDPVYGTSWRKAILNAKFFPLMDEDGQVQNVIVLVEDITEQARLEKQLVQAQKMEILGELAGGMAHDFNNFLAVSSLSLESLTDKLKAIRPDLADLEEIEELVQVNKQASELTSQLLQFTRSRQLQDVGQTANNFYHNELYQIGDLLKTANGLLQHAAGTEYRLKIADELSSDADSSQPLVKISPANFSQLLMNLVVNAKDALKEAALKKPPHATAGEEWKGEITIHSFTKKFAVFPDSGFQPARNSLSDDPESKLTYTYVVVPDDFESGLPTTTSTKRPMWYVGIGVEDNGIGIAPDQFEQIFVPLYTTKEIGRGTGLGLASCYAIARNNGGWFEVESQPGKGSRFNFYLPLVTPDRVLAQAVKTEKAANSLKSNSQVIDSTRTRHDPQPIPPAQPILLLVEDDAAIRNSLARQLSRAGWSVLTAEDGLQALQIVLSRHENNNNSMLNAIVSDCRMPGLDGISFLKEALTLVGDIPSVLMSGYIDEPDLIQDIEELCDTNHVKLLTKPFKIESLLLLLAQ